MKPTGFQTREPIAIIGIGCRFPGGVDSPEAFWKLLCDGRDAVIDVPGDRWDWRQYYDPDSAQPSKTHARQGGFLSEPVEEFDPYFFGMSVREAESLDPQQRLLLETSWRAIESAGMDILRLRGSKTGVFVGGFCMDNVLQRLGSASRHLIDAFTATSSSLTLLSNRLSHFYDLRGPSISLDTACSSSLVALHLACQSMHSGECDLALVGGVNVMLRPEFSIAMSKGRFLSTHSRSMAFDERAEGYTRGEGAGMVLLKPLPAARAAQDPIWAIIRGTGVNQDGQTPGITQPNPASQEGLIREVYGRCGILGKDIHFVEAHGTGTQVGDVAEVGSLNKVLGENRNAGKPCWVGAVKTNIGHLEAAAGIAATIKTALVLQQRRVPPNLHLQKLNHRLDPSTLKLSFPGKIAADLPKTGSLLAGVNSFGYGGTNAHALLESIESQPRNPDHAASSPANSTALLLPITAHTPTALAKRARLLAQAMRQDAGAVPLADWIHSTATRATHLSHRLVVMGSSRDALRRALESFEPGGQSADLVYGRAAEAWDGPVFVCSGMGPQWWGMGRELLRSEKVFREAFEHAARAIDSHSGQNLLEAFGKDEAGSKVQRADVAQPMLFVLQTALAALWRSWGIQPTAVVGHSAGEAAAAYISGALDLTDAALVCHVRSSLQQRVAGRGTMMAVGLGAKECGQWLEAFPGVSIAAINSAGSITVAGTADSLKRMSEALPESVFRKQLQVEIPYHSIFMDEIESDLKSALRRLKPVKTEFPFFSTVTGTILEGDQLTADYWWCNVRQPVEFAKVCESLAADGKTCFLEIGPHPVLGSNIRENLDRRDRQIEVLASLHRKKGELEQMHSSVARLYTLGASLNWQPLIPSGGRWTPLPPCPWEKQTVWLESRACRMDRLGGTGHPFVSRPAGWPRPAWEVEVNPGFFPYLKDHKLGPTVVFPGAGYLEAGLVAHRELFKSTSCILKNVRFENLLRVPAEQYPRLVLESEWSSKAWSVFSNKGGESTEWTRHALGRLQHLAEPALLTPMDLKSIRSDGTRMEAPELYEKLGTRGLNYGPGFRTVKELWILGNRALVRIEATLEPTAMEHAIVHPTLLDGAFQALVAMVHDGGTAPRTFVPSSIEKLICSQEVPQKCWALLHIHSVETSEMVADIQLADDSGRTLVRLENLRCKALPAASTSETGSGLVHEFRWIGVEDRPDKLREKVLLLGGTSTLRKEIEARLAGIGVDFTEDQAQATSGQVAVILGNPPVPGADIQQAVASSLALVEQLRNLAGIGNTRCLLVTHQCQRVTGEESEMSPMNSPWWGLAPVASNEKLVSEWQLLDLNLREEGQAAWQIVQELQQVKRPQETAWRGKNRFRREIRAVSRTPTGTEHSNLRDGSILITGGTRGFGLELARHFADRGASRLVLVSRSGAVGQDLETFQREMAVRGTKVEVRAVDVGNLDEVRVLVGELQSGPGSLRGVVHGAMVLKDGFLKDMTGEDFGQVFLPKAVGAWNLHVCTQELELDFFLCLSSISSFIGNPGQPAYAAANAFLDALAHYRRRHGLPSLTINLGLLSETGVVKNQEAIRRVLESAGVIGLGTGEAIQGIATAMDHGLHQAGVFRMDWQAWATAFPSASRDSRFSAMLGGTDAADTESADVRKRLLSLPDDQRRQALLEQLRLKMSGFIRNESGGGGQDRLSVDSLSMVEMIIRLNREFGIELSAVELLGSPSLDKLADTLLKKIEEPSRGE